MKRIVAAALFAVMALAACSSAAAPTPIIIYVTPAPVPPSAPASVSTTKPVAKATPIPKTAACTVTWFYTPSSSMTVLVATLMKGQDVLTGTVIDTEPITPCDKAQWLAGAGVGGNCQGTVCLGINDTPHGRYDRGLATLP